MTIENLFDVDCDNVYMVEVDSFEAVTPQKDRIKYGQYATEKQLSFLKSLFAERTNNEEAMILRTHLLGEYKAGKLSKQMASQAIEDALKMSRDPKISDLGVDASIEHGQIWITTAGLYVRIKESNASGRLYGLIWNGQIEDWDYELGRETNVMSRLDHICTAEEAKKWAQQWDAEFQRCVFCSRPLSDERSEFAGYGETCAQNNGLPWGAIE